MASRYEFAEAYPYSTAPDNFEVYPTICFAYYAVESARFDRSQEVPVRRIISYNSPL
jgi:hypothetical protein